MRSCRGGGRIEGLVSRLGLPAEETEPDMTSRPGGRGRGRGGGARPPPGHCNRYKFKGKCEKRSNGELCPYRHDLVARYVSSMVFSVLSRKDIIMKAK